MTIDMLRDALKQLEQGSDQGAALHKDLVDAATALVALAGQGFLAKLKPIVALDSSEAVTFSRTLEQAASIHQELQELVQQPSVIAACDILKAMLGISL